MHNHEEDEESGHFRPDAWKVAWEATQDVLAPSCEVKVAAEYLVWAEMTQQAVGWMLLTQMGVLLGSFGQIMSKAVCLLSWAIFMLEAMLKYARRWAHNHFFMDVPCAYVSIHEAGHDSLAFFGISLLSAVFLEIALYVPFIRSVVDFYRVHRSCVFQHFELANPDECPQGTSLLILLLLIAVCTTIVHWVTSVVTNYMFHSAIGVGVVFQEKKQKFRQRLSWHKSSHGACWCNEKGCKAKRMDSSPRNDSDRLLCLTWWVHMTRHGHLSAVVASAQSGCCGLPGHWFESVAQLKRIVDDCVRSGAGDIALNSDGPMWVSQEMALRALVNLANQGREETCREILDTGGFNILVQVVLDGKVTSCRGLAAAAIALLATQHDAIRKTGVDLTVAVVALKRLVRSKEHGLREVALGALLNTVLNDEQFKSVIDKIESSDGIVVGGSRGSFMTVLMEQAHVGPTARCQELATGLLARLAGNSIPARVALMQVDGTKLVGLELLIELLQHGLTMCVKASAAGTLAELAFKEGKTIGKGRYGESCIKALVNALDSGPKIASAAARALCNLGMKLEENKPRIVAAGGVGRLVELLEEPRDSDGVSRPKDVQAMTEEREQAQGDAAKALWMLAFHDQTNQNLIVQANAIPLLTELLCKSRTKVQIQAVAALCALAWNNERNQELIGREGATIFPRVVNLLIPNANNDENLDAVVLEKVSMAIRGFAEGSRANRDALLKAGAKLRLESAISKKDRKDGSYSRRDKALKSAKAALETLDKLSVKPLQHLQLGLHNQRACRCDNHESAWGKDSFSLQVRDRQQT